MVLLRFFGGSLAWLRGYIAPLPYTEPVKLLYGSLAVRQGLFGVIKVLYITPMSYKELHTKNLLSPFKGSLRAKEPLLVLFSTIFVEETQCNMVPLMVLHSTIWQRWCIAPLKMKRIFFLFVTYTIIQSITSSEMCSLHLTHPSAHTWSSGQLTLQRPWRSWRFGALLKGLTSVVDNSCWSRDSNPGSI